jgi:Glycosyl transferase family 2
MRLVAVSIVKNEADIIEAFVRHSLAWVDYHLIFDHDSTDGTRQILAALKAEGLPIALFTDDALGNFQQARSNHLTRLAVRDYAADWVLPLDADEILTGPSRAALEESLGKTEPSDAASLLLLNYYPTEKDDQAINNPVLRLNFCQTSPPRTKKIFVPRQLAQDPEIHAGKGSHILFRGNDPLPDQPLSADFHLSHLALRSPQHQVLRVVLAELQKLSRGRAHHGLDVHYRLGFQLLAEDPALFFSTICSPETSLRFEPIEYRGTALKLEFFTAGWNRVVRALLPYLENLALSHGQLIDNANHRVPASDQTGSIIRELTAEEIAPVSPTDGRERFSGFVASSGWGGREGPVPEAFLPPFHWGYAPATKLIVHSNHPRLARLIAEGLTYSEGQTVRVELNGITLVERSFPRTNQKESLCVMLPLQAGENQLVFHYTQSLVTDFDSRKLAVIFVSLRVID